MKYLKIWQHILSNLENQIDTILLIVVNHQGSSPGKTGFKMIHSTDGGKLGTIGGGVMEFNLLKKAKRMLLKKDDVPKLLKQKHSKKSKDLEISGLICSGQQYTFMYRLSNHDLDLVNSIIHCYANLSPKTFEISEKGIKLLENTYPVKFDYREISASEWLYHETIGDPNIAYIFGGGHVGNQISKILSFLDFYVIVMDNRENLEMLENNKFADKKLTGKYGELASKIKAGENSFVIITTFTADTDIEILKEVLKRKFKYIGVMGSHTKLTKIFNSTRELGYNDEVLKIIHTPIGLPISDGSVEEIAISVAAEVIKIKNNL